MGIQGPNGDTNFSTMKNIAESMLRNSGIKKPTSAQIVQKMVELAKEGSNTKLGDDLPIGFTLYRTSGQTEAPTDVPTDTPTQAPVYDAPTPPDSEPVTAPPTDPPEDMPVPTEVPTDTVTQAPVYDVPTPPDSEPITAPPTDPPEDMPVPTEVPTDTPTQAPVYDVPTPPNSEPVTAPPTDPPEDKGTTEVKTPNVRKHDNKKAHFNKGQRAPEGCTLRTINGQYAGNVANESGIYIIIEEK